MKKYDIAAYIWPAYTGQELRTRIFWPDGIGEWQTVRLEHKNEAENYEWNRKPLWGYVDEADPQVMEMQIEEATKHGVNVFIYDWYWYDNRPFLENCLNDGFLKAPNCNKMKFYLMWANHDATYGWDRRISSECDAVVWRGDVTEEQFHVIGRRWIEKYFCLDNYYKVDGGVKPIDPVLVEPLGFASLTHYQIAHYMDVNRDYNEIIKDMVKEWNQVIRTYQIPYSPHVSIGWDNNPRYKKFRPQIVKNNTPENFEKALREVKAFADEHCDLPLITINSWNEWTETSYLEPDNLYGYGYLDAIKKVFTEE